MNNPVLMWNEAGIETRTDNKKGNWIYHILRSNCLLKHVIGRKVERRKDSSDGETRKKKYAATG